MAIDQSPLGNHIQEMMQEIEQDPDIPDGAHINRIITIVEIEAPGDTPEEAEAMIRMRSNARPYVAIGFLEVAKALQLKMMTG